MRKILAAVLLLMTASFAVRGQTCAFTAAQNTGDLRLFTLTPPPTNLLFNFGPRPTDPAHGVFWKTALGTEIPMEVVDWRDREIKARIPAGERVCAGTYQIILRLPNNLLQGTLLDCAPFIVVLTPQTAPNGADLNACGSTPQACVITPVPPVPSAMPTFNPGDWVPLTTVPLGSLTVGSSVTLSCAANGRELRTLTVERRFTMAGAQYGIRLPTEGLDCTGLQYGLQSGQCRGVITILVPLPPLPQPQLVDCGAVQSALNSVLSLRAPQSVAPGQPVVGSLLNATGAAVPLNAPLPLPAIPAGVSITSVRWSISDDPNRDTLTPGSDYVADGGANIARASFTLAPQVVAARSGVTPQPLRRFIRAVLTLRVAPAVGQATTCSLPLQVPFLQAPLPVPTVLVLFRRADFDTGQGLGRDAGNPLRRGVLVIVPPDAVDIAGRPITGIGRLVVELNRLSSVLPSGSFPASSPLGSAAAFALGLQTLSARLSEVTRDANYSRHFMTGTQVQSLRDIRLMPGGTAAEDMFNSLIYVGPPGSGVGFFNNQKLVVDQGAFDLRLNRTSPFASVRSLDFADNAGAAPLVTGGTVNVTTRSGGPKYALIGNEIWGDDFCCHQPKSFGAELSSLRLFQ